MNPPAQDPATRTVLLVTHTGRPEAVEVATAVAKRLMASDIGVRLLEDEAPSFPSPAQAGRRWSHPTPTPPPGASSPWSSGETARSCGPPSSTRETITPLLGINLGHVGFLAEAEWDDLDTTVEAIIEGTYFVEERQTIDVRVLLDGVETSRGWALNEASVEKAARQRMLEVVVEIDGRPLSRWGCDGVVFATPTGSTAYAFSAGGPVVWPEVDALLLVPISAHALFARPLVASPDSLLAVEVLAQSEVSGVLWCDGRRPVDLPSGARVEVRRGAKPVRLARLHEAPFTDRLVAKFDLPVSGWRGGGGPRRPEARSGPADA